MRKPTNLINYSTRVAPEKTAFELQTLLAGKGAKSIFIEYQNGKPSALAFEITLNGVDLNFRLPSNIEGAYQAMCSMSIQRAYKNKEQAERTAWRNLLMWVEAQIAMVEMRQVEMAEVFFPYMIATKGSTQTLFQIAKENPMRLIENVMPENRLLGSGDSEIVN